MMERIAGCGTLPQKGHFAAPFRPNVGNLRADSCQTLQTATSPEIRRCGFYVNASCLTHHSVKLISKKENETAGSVWFASIEEAGLAR
jgi:hypothetical protein